MSDLRDEVTKRLTGECAASIDGIIMAGLPRGFDIAKITRARIMGARFEIWSYEGRPFLELHDPEPTSAWDGGDTARIGFTMNYRYLNT